LLPHAASSPAPRHARRRRGWGPRLGEEPGLGRPGGKVIHGAGGAGAPASARSLGWGAQAGKVTV